MRINAKHVDDVDLNDEWVNADLYQHKDEHEVPGDLDLSYNEYAHFILAEPYGLSDINQPVVIYPVKDDGTLPNDYTWEPIGSYEEGEQLSLLPEQDL